MLSTLCYKEFHTKKFADIIKDLFSLEIVLVTNSHIHDTRLSKCKLTTKIHLQATFSVFSTRNDTSNYKLKRIWIRS